MSALSKDLLPALSPESKYDLEQWYRRISDGCCGECDRIELLARLARIERLRGEVEATRRWAHWHNGSQEVGSCGTKLSDALLDLEHELALLEDDHIAEYLGAYP